MGKYKQAKDAIEPSTTKFMREPLMAKPDEHAKMLRAKAAKNPKYDADIAKSLDAFTGMNEKIQELKKASETLVKMYKDHGSSP